jgi:hypothetical protein
MALESKHVYTGYTRLMEGLPVEVVKGYASGRMLAFLVKGGTYPEYLEQQQGLPLLSPGVLLKLRLLTVLSLVADSGMAALKSSASPSIPRCLPYPLLMQALGMDSIRELEDVLIEGIYRGLFSGTLHHVERVFVVGSCQSREQRSLDECAALLSAWYVCLLLQEVYMYISAMARSLAH